MLTFLKIFYNTGLGIFYAVNKLISIKNYFKFQILRLFYYILIKTKGKAFPEFKTGEYCFYLDRDKKELIPVEILDLRWEYNENYEIYVKGNYKNLIGYYIKDLKITNNSQLWGKLAYPYDLLKINDEELIDILKTLYKRD